MNGFWIHGATLMTSAGPRDADLRVDGERIAEIRDREPGIPAPEGAIPAHGLWLMPGGVDVHTHFGMPLRPGLSSRGWGDSSTAALLGGTTTVVDFANPDPAESLADAHARWRAAAAGECLCDHAFHVTVPRIDDAVLDEIPRLAAEGLPTFKGFLAYKGRLMLSLDELRALMVVVRDAGARLLLHAEDGELNARHENSLREAGRLAPRYHPDAHSVASEAESAVAALGLVRETGCPLTIVHTSTADAMDAVANARESGLDVSAEVCTQHLFRDDGWYRRGDDAALTAIMSPPLRPAEHPAALRRGLADGRLSWLATDHCEFPLAVKRSAAVDGFPSVPNGAAGVGERLIVSHTLAVTTGLITPARWVDVCCEAPARAMGLGHRKGRLEPGLDADLVLFDPRARSTLPINADASLWTCDDWRGAVRDVWLRGRPVVHDGALSPGVGPGLHLTRSL